MPARTSRRRVAAALAGATMLALAGLSAVPASAGSADHVLTVPTKPGKVSAGWEGTIPQGASVLLVGDPLKVCDTNDKTKGDRETFKINVPRNLDPSLDVTAVFAIDWTPQSDNGGVQDEKIVVLGPDGKTVVGESDTGGQTYESTGITLVQPGTYTAVACPFQNPSPMPYTGRLDIIVSRPVGHVAHGVTRPAYKQHTAPEALAGAKSAGEPSLGVSWKTGNAMFQAGVNTFRVSFDDSGKATWVDKTGKLTGVDTFDPILWTDQKAGRTFVSQLFLACSAAEYTDNDGDLWLPSQGCGEGTGIDHQSIGGGPFPASLKPLSAAVPSAIYYCTNGAAAATCGRSDDGGATFTTVTPALTTECSVLHGHIRVGPDGAVYLPSASCEGKQGVSVSLDGGVTWALHQIPDSLAGTSDPSVSVSADNTVYFGYSDGSGKPKVAVSTDHGATWRPSVDVGVPYRTKSSEFAETVAGDGDRAAFAFLGTPTDGDFQGAGFGIKGDRYTGGEWHMYVATTYDRGRTWTTVDATPKDPVQRGCVWNRGGKSACRNLLDFNDITTDKMGRVLIGFADGCTTYSDCVRSRSTDDNKHEKYAAILRQTYGKGLFKAYDGRLPGSGKAKRQESVSPAPAGHSTPERTSSSTAAVTGTSVPETTAALPAEAAVDAKPAAATTGTLPAGTLALAGAVMLGLALVPSRRRR